MIYDSGKIGSRVAYIVHEVEITRVTLAKFSD